MKSFLRWISKVRNGLRDIFVSLVQLKEVKKIERKTRCKVLYISKDGLIHEFIGKLSNKNDMLLIPMLNGIFWVSKLYHDEKLRPTAFVSEKYHYTLDFFSIQELMDEELSDDDIVSRIKSNKINSIGKTLNLNVFDNDESLDFSELTYKVIVTKAFEALEEPARRTILIAFSFGLLIGMIIALVLAFWMWVA